MKRITVQMYDVKETPPMYHENHLEIIVVLKGSIYLYNNEKCIVLHEGEFSFINRNRVHYLKSEGAIILSYKIRLESFKHIFERIHFVEFVSINNSDSKRMALKEKYDAILLELLIREYFLLKDGKDKKEINFVENQLMNTLYSIYQVTLQNGDVEITNHELINRYYSVVEFVQNHIGEKISNEDIANRLYMNSAYFSQFMKKVGGIGFKEFVLYKKLSYMVILLLDDSYYLDEIALMTGITDAKSFFSLFKKYFNTSPSKWRKMIKSIKADYEEIDHPKIVKEFIIHHKIDKHKENTITKYVRYLVSEKILKDSVVMINPYEDMDDVFDRYYQPFKLLHSFIEIAEKKSIILHWIFPYECLMDGYHRNLFFEFLKHGLSTVGYSQLKKWAIFIMVNSNDEIEGATRLVKEVKKMINPIGVFISFKIIKN